MNEASNGAVAALCKELRTEPQSIAALKRPRRFSRQRAKPPEALTKSLRAEIVAARNLLNADRAERAGAAAHIILESHNSRDSAPGLPPADMTPPPPAVTVASAAGGEMEKAPEPAHVAALVAGVSAKAVEWVEDVKAAVASALTGEKRAELEADAARLEAASALFQDTPDDLRELL
jgi:type IV secretion system protein VirD4